MTTRGFVLPVILVAALLAASPGAQAQPAPPTIGFLRSTPAQPFAHLVTAFRDGLKDAGFVEGQNVAVEYRYADNRADRLSGLVEDLLRRQVAVIVCNQGAVDPARAATTTVPIVFVTGGDPVRLGLVTSLSRPGGNLTGVTFFAGAHSARSGWSSCTPWRRGRAPSPCWRTRATRSLRRCCRRPRPQLGPSADASWS